MIPIGFEQVVPAVVASGAPVTLLIGPEGIGKAMAAKAVVEQAVAPYDARWLPSCGVGDVRDLGRFVSVASATGRKMVGLDLDGATESSQHALLKMLEEPPRGVRFVLTSSGSLLPTVRSRSEIVVCPPLSFDQVVQVLVKHHGWTVLAARPAAALSGGRVSVALEWGDVTATRMQVLGAVKALGTGDREIWTRAVKDWSPLSAAAGGAARQVGRGVPGSGLRGRGEDRLDGDGQEFPHAHRSQGHPWIPSRGSR